MAAFGEVGLQNLSEQISFQQVVRHGEKLSDHLVEILRKTEKRKSMFKFYLKTKVQICEYIIIVTFLKYILEDGHVSRSRRGLSPARNPFRSHTRRWQTEQM